MNYKKGYAEKQVYLYFDFLVHNIVCATGFDPMHQIHHRNMYCNFLATLKPMSTNS